jgi:excisionase family DNA binding protein
MPFGGCAIGFEVPPELVEEIARRAAELVGASVVEAADQWLDSEGAAEYLALPRSSLHKLTSSRAIPFSQDVPGGKLYFKRSALDAWRMSP